MRGPERVPWSPFLSLCLSLVPRKETGNTKSRVEGEKVRPSDLANRSTCSWRRAIGEVDLSFGDMGQCASRIRASSPPQPGAGVPLRDMFREGTIVESSSVAFVHNGRMPQRCVFARGRSTDGPSNRVTVRIAIACRGSNTIGLDLLVEDRSLSVASGPHGPLLFPRDGERRT